MPSKRNRKVPIPQDAMLYRQRHKIENRFDRLKDWRRIHTRYDPPRSHLHVGHLHRCNRHLLD
ncbi:transposase [Sphingobium sp. Cam5-1]|uniref:transposase n=1 Tax=Sphingobium sp. Cam5-1 TaxID=2789327 RepID=UPI003FA70F26